MSAATKAAAPLLEIEGLTVEFGTDAGTVHAVDGVSLTVSAGEIIGVVGESGSGKSVTAMSGLGLITPPGRTTAGSVRFKGRDLLAMPRKELRAIRGASIAMVFQDPMTALNPVASVGTQIAETLRLHDSGLGRRAARDRAIELLRLVGVPNPEVRVRQYPHEYSGGMRQRAVVAMAIANGPELLIADEPTTALDVTVQAQVLQLLKTAQHETGAATILITHDLGVVAEMVDRVVVMYAGHIVEQADVHELFREPRHPYTAGLLASMPDLDVTGDLLAIPGNPPNMLSLPRGCRLAPRCPLARDRCRTDEPPLLELENGRRTACHFHEELVGADARSLYASKAAAGIGEVTG